MNGYELTGERFGRLAVLRYSHSNKNKQRIWECQCDCGNIIFANSNQLVSGNTRSCGCLQKEIAKAIGRKVLKTHGLSKVNGKKTRLYRIWAGMNTRCNNPNDKAYKEYGGRGIHICKEWREKGFKAFHNWAIANGYKESLTIDRIDNNKGYSPENCRWATYKEQNRNKRSNTILAFNGVCKTICEWAEQINISEATICGRLKRGWSIEETLTTNL